MGDIDEDGGTGQCLPPVLTGVPSDLQQNALGALRLHGALRVATQLVGALEASLADLTIGGGASATDGSSRPEGAACTAAQDEELLKAIAEDSTTLCFVNRHLLLFDQGLVIADAAVEAISRTDGVTRQMRCQFRHFLSFSQIALLVCIFTITLPFVLFELYLHNCLLRYHLSCQSTIRWNGIRF